VAILTGIGGGNGNDYVPGMAAYTYGNQGRLVVFKLGGGEVPKRPPVARETMTLSVPVLPRRGSEAQIARGAELFVRNCAKCHANIDGRGAGIPDLKFMDEATHRDFEDIVLKGTRIDKGMGDFSDLLTKGEVDALHVYLIDEAWRYWEKHTQADWHQAGN